MSLDLHLAFCRARPGGRYADLGFGAPWPQRLAGRVRSRDPLLGAMLGETRAGADREKRRTASAWGPAEDPPA